MVEARGIIVHGLICIKKIIKNILSITLFLKDFQDVYLNLELDWDFNKSLTSSNLGREGTKTERIENAKLKLLE